MSSNLNRKNRSQSRKGSMSNSRSGRRSRNSDSPLTPGNSSSLRNSRGTPKFQESKSSPDSNPLFKDKQSSPDSSSEKLVGEVSAPQTKGIRSNKMDYSQTPANQRSGRSDELNPTTSRRVKTIDQAIEKFKEAKNQKSEVSSLQTKVKDGIIFVLEKNFDFKNVDLNNPTVSDIFLSICYVALTRKAVPIKGEPSREHFWEFVRKQEGYCQVFNGLSEKVLLICWANIKKIENLKMAISQILNSQVFLASKSINIKPFISLTSQYFKDTSRHETFEDFINRSRAANRSTILDAVETKGEARIRRNYGEAIKIPFNRLNPAGPLHTKMSIEEHGSIENLLRNELKEKLEEHGKVDYGENATIIREIGKAKRKMLEISMVDKMMLESLYSLTKELKQLFPDVEENYIVSVLDQCSMNIQQAVQVLEDPSQTKVIFSQSDDIVLLKMKNTSAYKALVREKGQENVDQRVAYLNN